MIPGDTELGSAPGDVGLGIVPGEPGGRFVAEASLVALCFAREMSTRSKENSVTPKAATHVATAVEHSGLSTRHHSNERQGTGRGMKMAQIPNKIIDPKYTSARQTTIVDCHGAN